jgi:beta-mannanase
MLDAGSDAGTCSPSTLDAGPDTGADDAPSVCAACATAGTADAGAGRVALGAFIHDEAPPIGDGCQGGIAPNDTTAMANYAAMVGGKPSIVMWYEKWAGQTSTAFPAADADRVVQFGATPMITWEACDPKGGRCQNTAPSQYTDKNIAAGKFDSYLTSWAQGAKAWGKPFFLRLNHEMNGTWYPWGTNPKTPTQYSNQNTHEDYVAAWKHVHQLFDSVGVTNATWVWSPNVITPITQFADDFASDYPGDAWVDWVALDGYNWGNGGGNVSSNTWTSFVDLFAASYAELTSLTSKPLMFAETASAPGPGGDKACWITEGFLCDLPTYFPRTRAVIWFDADGAGNGEADWRVNSSRASLDAWMNVVRTPYFQAGPPL